MTVSALVSGGKDSIFAASLADAQGLAVDELVTLVPADPESMLFHTPNLDLVALQAEAWGKRHRRVPIPGRGEAAEAAVLADALEDPDRGAIVAGAIASTYQYYRLLRIADRLGRRVYAPLWGKRGEVVVAAEVAAGLDIRFVHLAAEGLPDRWLGERLDATAVDWLTRQAAAPRAIHPAGEGGEFETLVVDAPFFRSRIRLESTETHRTSAVGRLSVRAARLEAKRPAAPGAL